MTPRLTINDINEAYELGVATKKGVTTAVRVSTNLESLQETDEFKTSVHMASSVQNKEGKLPHVVTPSLVSTTKNRQVPFERRVNNDSA